jgi:hypothetical protein
LARKPAPHPDIPDAAVVTPARCRAALATVLRWFADPVRRNLAKAVRS